MQFKLKPSVAWRVEKSDPNQCSFRFLYIAKTPRSLTLLIEGKATETFTNLLSEGFNSADIITADTPLAQNALRVLIERGLFASPSHDPTNWHPTYSRLDRQLRLISSSINANESPTQIQASMASKHITILGLGGMGSNILLQLLLMGFKKFCLIDDDVVTDSNLNRQIIFLGTALGKQKAQAAKQWAQQYFGDLEIQIIPKRLEQALPEIPKSDLIINCADQPSILETTRSLLRAPLDAPVLVGGGYYLMHCFVGPLIHRGESACLDCAASPRNPEHLPAVGGNIAPLVLIAASFACLEAFKLLSGLYPTSLTNTQFVLRGHDMSLQQKKLIKNDRCPTCSLGKT